MNSSSADAAHPLLEVRGARSSSVIVQRIPETHVQSFMDWQRGITAAAAEFPGYQATEIYPPLSAHEEWVIIVHFDNPRTLESWFTSPVRAEWLARLPCEVRDYRLKTLPGGFGPWFAGLDQDGTPLPHWKMALAVLFGLYPTAMVLTLYLWPYMQSFGLALAMLVSNAVSVCFLEWMGMPVLNRVLRPWFRANGKEGRTVSLIGLVVMTGILGALLVLFRWMKD